MIEEVYFNKEEAVNIESFRRYIEAMGLSRQATAPEVYKQCSTRRVLTMERLYGVPLTDLDYIISLVSSPEASIITALNVWFGSLLACETFHADVHAGNLWLSQDDRIGFLDFDLIPSYFSHETEEYESMASALIEMGATNKDVDYKALARDVEMIFSSIQVTFKFVNIGSMASALIEMGATNKDVDYKALARDVEMIFSSIQDLYIEIVVAAARGPNANTTVVSANLVVDERQMNALFLVVEFVLLMKQLLYFDQYTRLLAPNLNMLQDQRISIVSNRSRRNMNIYQ
ncbi:putative aarF domain-containing protein kinase [Actinidia chinensis var. chinensis]|uniref:Putative aarF domain-containing protein kinase n=1 Tax=Actinidia chinensis var. chinensis TaxID=1590841 RepID=A0A2R6RWK7_ACTCC|nr:putative aarF domain-containing protein kinase [Actinidia chinensis var. chinensis]